MNRSLLYAVIAATAGLTACGEDSQRPTGSPSPAATTLAPTSPDPSTPAGRNQINTQDRFTEAERQRQDETMESRPLLNHLPVTRQGVTIDIGGLTSDDRPLITITAPGINEATARAVYDDVLREFDDRGRGYKVEVVR